REAGLQHVPDRRPVDPGRLHGDVGAAVGREPLGQGEQVAGGRAEGAHLVSHAALRSDPRTGDDRLLVDIEARALRVADFQGPLRIVTLSASLALHSGVLLAVLLAVSGETELGALFIDLTESAVPEAAASNAATSTPAAAGRGGARAVRSIAAARLAPTPPVL